MNSQDKIQHREERLREFFTHEETWQYLKLLLQERLELNRLSLIGLACRNRDYYAGKCQAIIEFLDMENEFAEKT